MIGKNSVRFSLPFMGSTKARMRAKEDGGAQRSQGGVRIGHRTPHIRTPPGRRCAPTTLPMKGREKGFSGSRNTE
jgi:hypothetical protein